MKTFAVNVVPVAKVDEWREFAAEAESGEYADDHRAMLRRIGVESEHIFIQDSPDGAQMVLVWEGIEPERAQQAMGQLMLDPQSDYERTVLLDRVVRELHGLDPTGAPPPAVEKVVAIET